jgi:kynurenine formamidase
MRAVPDEPLTPWEPPQYRVDSSGKLEGARPGTPNNWDRFGTDDQAGTANLFTPDRIVAAARLARTGKRFTLGIPIGPPAPGARPAPLHFFRHSTGDTLLGDTGMFPGQQISDDYVVMALQGTTQLDGLCHVAVDDSMFNGYWAGLVTGGTGARRLGVHHFAEGLVGRAVVLDVARRVGVDRLDAGFGIGPDLLDEVASSSGVEVRAGDVLLVRTGWLEWWYAQPSPPGPEGMLCGGLTAACLPWLAERDVAMVASDNVAVEVIPWQGEQPLPFHAGALRDLGLPLGELLDLGPLAADCADDGVYECMFVACPLPVVNGAGSPINPLAIK